VGYEEASNDTTSTGRTLMNPSKQRQGRGGKLHASTLSDHEIISGGFVRI
jgi:hypothetical protein